MALRTASFSAAAGCKASAAYNAFSDMPIDATAAPVVFQIVFPMSVPEARIATICSSPRGDDLDSANPTMLWLLRELRKPSDLNFWDILTAFTGRYSVNCHHGPGGRLFLLALGFPSLGVIATLRNVPDVQALGPTLQFL